MVLERQHITGNGSSANPDHQFQKISSKRVRAVPSANIYRPPAARRLEGLGALSVSSSTTTAPVAAEGVKTEKVRIAKQRRPDIQVYVPRAKRTSLVESDLGQQRAQQPEIPVPRRSLDSSHRQSSCNGAVAKPTNTSSSPHSRRSSGHFELSVEDNGNTEHWNLPTPNSRVMGKKNEPSLQKTRSEENPVSVPLNFKINPTPPEPCVVDGEQNESDLLSKDLNNSPNLAISRKMHEDSVGAQEAAWPSSTGNTPGQSGRSSPSVVWEGLPQTDGLRLDDSKSSIEQVNLSSSCEKLNFSAECDNECKTSSNGSVENQAKGEDTSEQNGHNETTKPSEEVVNLDILTMDPVRECKKDKEEDCRLREEQNRKNRRILRGNFMSDVLIISEPETPPTKPVVEKDLSKNLTETTVVKKKKVSHKAENAAQKAPPAAFNSSNVSSAPKLNPDECTWEMMFDDDGECLDPNLMEELTTAVGSVTITKPQSDYGCYQSKPEVSLPGAGDEFAHVVEIYNFPPEFKTQDLLSVFSPYKNGGFEIKWVDDTHALGVFSSSVVASDVLATEHPFVKTRPLRDATPESRTKARRSAEFMQPYRPRPETCAALARRLVTGALGVRLNTSREEREAERRQLKEAREKKRLVAKQRDEAWEGTLGEK